MTIASPVMPRRASVQLEFVWRETTLLLVWAFVFLLGGTISGLISYALQVVSTVFMALVTIVWLGVRIGRRRAIPLTGLEVAVLGFMAAQAVATALSQDARRGLPLLAQSIAYGLVFFCAYDAIKSGWPAAQVERTLLVVGSVVVILVGWDLSSALSVWWKLVSDQMYTPDFQYRSYAVFGDANLLAAVLNLITLLALARGLATPKRASRLWLAVLVAAAVAGQVVTRSRGGAMGLAVGLLALAGLWVVVVSPTALAGAKIWLIWLRARRVLLGMLLLALASMLGLAAWRIFSFTGSATQAPVLSARAAFWRAARQAFDASPVWGRGPGTYPTEYMRAGSVPPDRPYLHAHSVLFTTAAEAGLLGVGALLLAAAVAARQLWRVRRKASLSARARWAGAAACWAGFAAHSQVDDHTRFLSVAVPLAVVLACALAEDAPVLGSALGKQRPGVAHWKLWWLDQRWGLGLAGLAVAAGLFQVLSLRAYQLANRAVEAGLAGDWREAAQRFDEAAAADPQLAFYAEQAGYAYSRLVALGEVTALEPAIARWRQAVRLEPNYALHHANLAGLLWQSGERSDALASMRRAVELAPQSEFLHLNVGLYLEATGQLAAAAEAYRTALSLDPLQGQGEYWSATPLRSSVRAIWWAETGRPNVDTLDLIARLAAGGQPGVSEQQLIELWRQDRQEPLVYVGLANTAFAQGDLAQAQRYIDIALWVQTLEVENRLPAILLSAEIARQQGRPEAALSAYQSVFSAVTEYGSLGWGTAGWTPHASFVFQRRALPLDVVPQVVRPGLTPELTRRLLPLAALYAARGDSDQAQIVLSLLTGDDGQD